MHLMDEFLQKLDSADFFIDRKESEIAMMKRAPALSGEDCMEKYEAYMDVAGGYVKFVGDSCVAYLDSAIKTARAIGAKSQEQRAMLSKANTLSLLGHFLEARDIISSVEGMGIGDSLRSQYYRVCFQLYYSLRFNSFNEDYHEEYDSRCEAYRDSLLLYATPGSDYYLRNIEKRLAYKGQHEDAFAINCQRLEQAESKRSEALVMYDRFILKTRYMGEPVEDWLDALLLSSIADIESANQDVASLRTLEKYLLNISDVRNAKKVSDYYYSTMERYGSRLRRIHGFEYAMDVNMEHIDLIARKQRQLAVALIFMTFLLLIAIILISVILNMQKKVKMMNNRLEVSNAASRRYVLGFFQLYSDYIERLLYFRAKINTGIRRGNTQYVLELTNPDRDVNDEELKQLYKNFDEAFLDIFPDYVASFNACLRPEFRYGDLPKGTLSTELRIFALIKMGEKDSSTISKLLHCSIKTVYNKRSEIKKKLLSSDIDFEKKLAEI